ncbi:MAG TPA: hypothetical protein VF461_03365 [Gemmatimonadaceae bacterium]
MRRSRHSLAWRARRAVESATTSRPLIGRTGPAWGFGLLGLVGELAFAPVVLAITVVIGVCCYLVIDAPWTRLREQQRPRFLSVRILYLNTLILVGFWLAVMFSFSAADPSMSSSVAQRFPEVLDASTALEFTRIVHLNQTPLVRSTAPLATASTWFGVFLHGLVSALTVNLLLFALVATRRQVRGRQVRSPRREGLQYDARLKLFVDGERSSIG